MTAKEISRYLLNRSFNAGITHGDCFHAEHVVRAMNHYEALIKEVAELAFDAGYMKGLNDGSGINIHKNAPHKEQFINDLFK